MEAADSLDSEMEVVDSLDSEMEVVEVKAADSEIAEVGASELKVEEEAVAAIESELAMLESELAAAESELAAAESGRVTVGFEPVMASELADPKVFQAASAAPEEVASTKPKRKKWDHSEIVGLEMELLLAIRESAAAARESAIAVRESAFMARESARAMRPVQTSPVASSSVLEAASTLQEIPRSSEFPTVSNSVPVPRPDSEIVDVAEPVASQAVAEPLAPVVPEVASIPVVAKDEPQGQGATVKAERTEVSFESPDPTEGENNTPPVALSASDKPEAAPADEVSKEDSLSNTVDMERELLSAIRESTAAAWGSAKAVRESALLAQQSVMAIRRTLETPAQVEVAEQAEAPAQAEDRTHSEVLAQLRALSEAVATLQAAIPAQVAAPPAPEEVLPAQTDTVEEPLNSPSVVVTWTAACEDEPDMEDEEEMLDVLLSPDADLPAAEEHPLSMGRVSVPVENLASGLFNVLGDAVGSVVSPKQKSAQKSTREMPMVASTVERIVRETSMTKKKKPFDFDPFFE